MVRYTMEKNSSSVHSNFCENSVQMYLSRLEGPT